MASCVWAAWRCATGCSYTGRPTGRRRCATATGEIRVASGRKPRVQAVDKVPGVRGVVRLAEAFAVIPIVKRNLPGRQAAVREPGRARRRRRRLAWAARCCAAACAACPARRPPPRSRSLPRCSPCAAGSSPQYHGVEHKAIAAYEAPEEADAADKAKEHDRCGSHLVAPMLASNVAGTLLLRRVVERPGPVAGGAVALASTAAAVEVFAWCERNSDTPDRPRAAPPRLRDPAAGRHARAGRAPARGRPRRARRDPAGRAARTEHPSNGVLTPVSILPRRGILRRL